MAYRVPRKVTGGKYTNNNRFSDPVSNRVAQTLTPAKTVLTDTFLTMTDFSTPRINASMMPSYQGRNVCLMGMAKDVITAWFVFKMKDY